MARMIIQATRGRIVNAHRATAEVSDLEQCRGRVVAKKLERSPVGQRGEG